MVVPPRSAAIFHYPAVPACVYCGSERQLTDEHIIPLSLGGVLILDKASCKACSEITKKLEQTVARDMFGRFRIRHGIRTRRPKIRPTHYDIGMVTPDGSRTVGHIPVKDYPSPVMMYKFGQPNMLRDVPRSVDTFVWTAYMITAEADVALETYRWDGRLSLRAVPVEFARLLAKIGHCYAIAELGANSFHPLAPDVILGRDAHIGEIVGGDFPDTVTSTPDDLEPPIPDAGHLLDLDYLLRPGRPPLVIANIRLFASISTPTYRVVVGEVRTLEHIRVFAQHAAGGGGEGG